VAHATPARVPLKGGIQDVSLLTPWIRGFWGTRLGGRDGMRGWREGGMWRA